MKDKLIGCGEDKEQAIVLASGLIGLARIIGGGFPLMAHHDRFLDDNEKMAESFVDRLMKAEDDEDECKF